MRKREGDREIRSMRTFNNAVRILFAIRGDEAFESLVSRQWIVNNTIQETHVVHKTCKQAFPSGT